MRKSLRHLTAFVVANIICIFAFAQTTTIRGNIKNSVTGDVVSAASITVKGSGAGTFTDDNGDFTLTTTQKFPVTLIISSIGYETQEVTVSNASENVQVSFKPASALGQEIVIAATRTPSRILESPVTIERISAANIRNSPTPSYYDIIGKLKGVDVVNSSLTYATASTRGFNGSGSTRVNQIVDGMDNQAPGLNFPVGAVIGLTQLDVESVELLPGASSALYGPGGMNGAILITSKDPFKYQGLSFDIKTGVMHVEDPDRKQSPYFDWSVRWAKKISQKFAFKIGAQLIQAKDWLGNDYRNYRRVGTDGALIQGTRETDPNYDGVNVYGDETTVDIRTYLNGLAAQVPFYAPYINSLPASINVSRTGYLEKDVVDPSTINFKGSGQINYKLTDKTTFILEGYLGTGNTVYTGSDRYSLKGLKMAQYKVELNNPNWFLRGYTTQENAGESFNATVTTRLFNEAWKKTVTFSGITPNPQPTDWLVQYSQAFLQNKLAGQNDFTAHTNARATADVGRPAPGSQQFKQIFNQVRSIPIVKGGGLFVDKTDLYNVEGQYNFSKVMQFAELIVGGNYKKYVLNSEGTLFADSAGKIGINEYGLYAQLTKRLMDDKLKFIVSGRYDKNENFEGRFTPRISAVIAVAPDNNLRLSYQTAYRFPSTQQQWINLRVGGGVRLLGGLQTFQEYYKFKSNPVYDLVALQAGNKTIRTFDKFKAESLRSFEAGYKGLLLNKRLLIDIYGFYGIYHDFTTRVVVAQSVSGNAADVTKANVNNAALVTLYSVPTNITGDVKTTGYGIGLDYQLPKNFIITANVTSDKLTAVPVGFQSGYNAPLYRVGASLANTGMGFKKAWGFNVTWRWQDDVDYQGDFANGPVPAFQTLDAQVSYKLPAQKVLIKVGATNLLNQYYRNGFGNTSIGG
ncbi:MAG TPA: TonB-dependent receptor, partial [Chitinophagaceae bacterium]|nr:TonB-dependent receptor [Chitinophagaceae bacterium]